MVYIEQCWKNKTEIRRNLPERLSRRSQKTLLHVEAASSDIEDIFYEIINACESFKIIAAKEFRSDDVTKIYFWNFGSFGP